MERWTRAMIRWRWLVIALWLVAILGSLVVSRGLGDLLTNRFTLPGTDTARAETILKEQFGQKPTGSFDIVAVSTSGNVQSIIPALNEAGRRAQEVVPTGAFVEAFPASPKVASATIVSSLEPADAKGYVSRVREALGSVPGATLYVTGQAAVEHDLEPIQDQDLKRGEFLIAIPIALVILIFVFGTLAFVIPFAFALSAIPVTLGVVWLFANSMELSTYVTQLVSLIGLGISVDYSLLMVYRYREERLAGKDKAEALVTTMQTAGRAVVFSGTAVAIGLAMLLAMPLPFMRGFGVAGLTIPIVSVICAMTLLPVLLYMTADGLDRVRLVPRKLIDRRADAEGSFWMKLAHAIMRRPVLFATGSTALLLAFAIPAFWLEVGPGTNQGIPQDLESTQALNILGEAAGKGATAPSEIVIDTGRPGGVQDPAVRASVDRLVAGTKADPETVKVVSGQGPLFVDPTGRYLRLQAIGRSEYGTPPAMDFVRRFRSDIVPAAQFPGGVSVYAGGGPPSSVDFLDLVYGTFPWLVLDRPRAHLLPAPAGIQVAAPAAEGDHPQPAFDRSRVRPSGRVLQVGVGRAVRSPELRPDRRVDSRLPVRDALRALDGLRGVPREPDAGGLGLRRAQPACSLAGIGEDRPYRDRCRD